MRDEVRRARHELVRAGLHAPSVVDGVVPDVIARSWRRSLSSRARLDGLNERFREVDLDTTLRTTADPVLDRWQQQLADTGATILVCDRGGTIVARRASERSGLSHLDRVNVAEGFDFSEESMGTNGLGTALAERAPVWIEGTQHYNDDLGGLSCAAVPLLVPSGSVIGSISVGAPAHIANPLMVSITREIGRQIEERLRASSRPEDLALAMSFMRYRNSRRPTVVIDQESLMANTPGLRFVDVDAHVTLWQMVNSIHWGTAETVRLNIEGVASRVAVRRVTEGPRVHYVVQFAAAEPVSSLSGTVLGHTSVGSLASAAIEPKPACIVVDGPAGAGRATRAREIGQEWANDTAWLVVTGGPKCGSALAEAAEALRSGSSVLMRRAELVAADDAYRFADLIAAAGSGGDSGSGALAITIDTERAATEIVDLLPATRRERIHALRHTPERIPGLVRQILERVDPQRTHSLSPAALQSLMQWRWPGNVAELERLLIQLVHDVPASVIERRHLPADMQQAAPKRQVSLMEEAERQAIVRALDAAGGNRSQAAEMLGIGRTTLYRRLRQLGFDRDERSL